MFPRINTATLTVKRVTNSYSCYQRLTARTATGKDSRSCCIRDRQRGAVQAVDKVFDTLHDVLGVLMFLAGKCAGRWSSLWGYR